MTHPFHPLSGRDFEFVEHRRNWGEDRICLHDANGEVFSLPAGWTNAGPADPFVVIAGGRCPFTIGGLLALVGAENLIHVTRPGDIRRSWHRCECVFGRRTA